MWVNGTWADAVLADAADTLNSYMKRMVSVDHFTVPNPRRQILYGFLILARIDGEFYILA